MGEGANLGLIPEFTVAQHDREVNVDIVTNLAIFDIRAAVDATARANGRVAPQLGVGTDHRVWSNGHVFPQVDRIRVFQSNTGSHPLAAQLCLSGLFHTG